MAEKLLGQLWYIIGTRARGRTHHPISRVAPVGLRDCGHERTQGLVALTGLRTLGSEKGRPAGAYPAAVESPQGLVALAGLRTLGSGKGRPAGAYPAARELPRGSTIGA